MSLVCYININTSHQQIGQPVHCLQFPIDLEPILVGHPRSFLRWAAFTTRIGRSWPGPVPVWLPRAYQPVHQSELPVSDLMSINEAHNVRDCLHLCIKRDFKFSKASLTEGAQLTVRGGGFLVYRDVSLDYFVSYLCFCCLYIPAGWRILNQNKSINQRNAPRSGAGFTQSLGDEAPRDDEKNNTNSQSKGSKLKTYSTKKISVATICDCIFARCCPTEVSRFLILPSSSGRSRISFRPLSCLGWIPVRNIGVQVILNLPHHYPLSDIQYRNKLSDMYSSLYFLTHCG
jgi:hypothetical protein